MNGVSINQEALTDLLKKATDIGLHILGAIALWIIGRWLIGLVTGFVAGQMKRRHMDTTIIAYALSTVTGLLNIILVISILGTFGVQTTTFAALFAAIGLAIGTAWSGLLANFAAGVFMILLRPFKVGDEISAGGTAGTVEEIGPFSTVIDTPENVRTIVGNNKILADNILNYSHNAHRRVVIKYQLLYGTDIEGMIQALLARIHEIPNTLEAPAPAVSITEYTVSGPKANVEVSCHPSHYSQVQANLAQAIRDVEIVRGIGMPPAVPKPVPASNPALAANKG